MLANTKLGDVLRHNARNLEEVNIRYNYLGDEGMRLLHDGLQRAQRLKRLVFECVGVTGESGRLLADIISRNPSMLECGFTQNRIGDTAFVGIGRSVGEMQTSGGVALFLHRSDKQHTISAGIAAGQSEWSEEPRFIRPPGESVLVRAPGIQSSALPQSGHSASEQLWV